MTELESDLYYAIEDGNASTTKLLLDTGADPNTVFWGSSFLLGSHWSALHICCQKGLHDCAKCLLDAGAKPNVGDGLQQTPLFYCVQWEWWEIVELLLRAGCDVNAVDIKGRTALHYAVECSDIRPLNLLLQFGANLDLQDQLGRTPLRIAASKDGKLDVVRALVRAGASVNIADASEKATPLQAALAHTSKDRAAYVNLLLSWGASVQAISTDAPTPVQSLITSTWADGPNISEEDLAYIQLFIRKGVDVDHVVERKCEAHLKGTALKMAAARGCVPLVRLLLEAGADPKLTDNTKVSPLLIASKAGHREVVKTLLHFGAVNDQPGVVVVDKEFRVINPFACALFSHHMDIAKMLVHAGCTLTQEKYLWTNEEVPKQLVLNLEFWNWLRTIVAQPMTLAHLSKIIVRQYLGMNIPNKVMNMNIPPVLKKYILELG